MEWTLHTLEWIPNGAQRKCLSRKVSPVLRRRGPRPSSVAHTKETQRFCSSAPQGDEQKQR